jgi:hypothetical protein
MPLSCLVKRRFEVLERAEGNRSSSDVLQMEGAGIKSGGRAITINKIC